MPSSDLSPLVVVPYSDDYLIGFVRHKTGWDQRSEVSSKPQLNYLCKYLGEKTHVDAQTIVVENDYIDRHYLEDYSAYYARCFPSHQRKCSRLHFFSDKFEESEFVAALESNDKLFFTKLSETYIGYAIIRPIPHTFIAKLSLKRYKDLITRPGCKIIVKDDVVSLFGVSLKVESAAFLEQDKVVSACATSALWMFFTSSEQEFNGRLPSPSAITKSATGSSHGGARTFPNSGLSNEQISRSLLHFGFEPTTIELPRDTQKLKEIIYGYVSNDIPILLGGHIFQKGADGKTRYAGEHLICTVGYQVEQDVFCYKDQMQLTSQRIEKIYVHDDRYGPYLRVSMDEVKLDHEGSEIHGFEFLLRESKHIDYFYPLIAIIGTYHKVRLPYSVIRQMCDAIYVYLQASKKKFDAVLKNEIPKKPELECHFQNSSDCINYFLNGAFDVTLTTSTAIKTELRSCDSFVTFNGLTSKTSCLLQNMLSTFGGVAYGAMRMVRRKRVCLPTYCLTQQKSHKDK